MARRWWAGEYGAVGRAAFFVGTPLSWLWQLGGWVRRARWGTPTTVPCPVISVGNLAVGGTGKTPLVNWFVRRARVAGHRPAVLVHPAAADEAALHRRWENDLAVHVGADRARTGLAACEGGATAVVIDDGFQYRRLVRALDVVVLNAEDPLPGRVLPTGPYREPLSALRRADLLVVTCRVGREAQAERGARWLADHLGPGSPSVAGVRFEGRVWNDLSGVSVREPERPVSVLAVTAIARPDTFFAELEERFDDVEGVAFADHHPYCQADVVKLRTRAEGRPIVVTEKDATKLAPFARELGPTWVVGQVMSWLWGEDEVRRRFDHALGVDVAP